MSTAQNRVPDLQAVINQDLFSTQPMVSQVKEVLEFIEPHAQPLSEKQIQAIAYLNYLGTRDLHKAYRDDPKNKGKHPYEPFVKWIMESAEAAAEPSVFVRVIEALIPRPPKITLNDGQQDRKRR